MRQGFEMQTLQVLYENAHNTEMDKDQVHTNLPTCPPHEPHGQHSQYSPCSSKQTALLQPQCTNGLMDCYCMLDY